MGKPWTQQQPRIKPITTIRKLRKHATQVKRNELDHNNPDYQQFGISNKNVKMLGAFLTLDPDISYDDAFDVVREVAYGLSCRVDHGSI